MYFNQLAIKLYQQDPFRSQQESFENLENHKSPLSKMTVDQSQLIEYLKSNDDDFLLCRSHARFFDVKMNGEWRLNTPDWEEMINTQLKTRKDAERRAGGKEQTNSRFRCALKPIGDRLVDFTKMLNNSVVSCLSAYHRINFSLEINPESDQLICTQVHEVAS